MTIRIAIIGFGKIARDQHVPSIAGDPRFELVAVSTRSGDPGLGLPFFAEAPDLFEAMNGRLDAVAICTPPLPRHEIAKQALAAGLHVLLEKPPTATLGEIEHLERLAAAADRSLFTAWHSQEAAAVGAAAEALAGETVTGLDIQWREDVRKWHPGQAWIWEAGGFGVFDPGINALSIVTRILPEPLFVREATLLVPENRQAPIAATLRFAGEAMMAEMDWRYGEGEQWTIRIDTASGRRLDLLDGGARLRLDGEAQSIEPASEYAGLYARFAHLVAAGASEVDREPLRIVADAFLVGTRETVEPFHG